MCPSQLSEFRWYLLICRRNVLVTRILDTNKSLVVPLWIFEVVALELSRKTLLTPTDIFQLISWILQRFGWPTAINSEIWQGQCQQLLGRSTSTVQKLKQSINKLCTELSRSVSASNGGKSSMMHYLQYWHDIGCRSIRRRWTWPLIRRWAGLFI